jgi:hypothetical protein
MAVVAQTPVISRFYAQVAKGEIEGIFRFWACPI